MKTLKCFATSIFRIEYLLIALVALCISDGLITHFLVTNGFGREGNPLMEGLIGDWKFPVIKAMGGLLCALILWDIYKRWSKLAMISTTCIVVVYAGIVIWNLYAYSLAA